jgi:putative phosphoesterase
MKKILVLSDTHGYIDDRILHYAKNSDEVWHAGDIGNFSVINQLSSISKIKAVYGNIDDQNIRGIYPEKNIFICEGLKVYITHIGGYPGSYNKKIKNELIDLNPDIFICGHSHILKIINDKKNNILHLNPGAAGNIGFHSLRTMIRFEISESKINNLEVIQLGKR